MATVPEGNWRDEDQLPWLKILNGSDIGGRAVDLHQIGHSTRAAANDTYPGGKIPQEIEMLIEDVEERLRWAEKGLQQLAKTMLTRIQTAQKRST